MILKKISADENDFWGHQLAPRIPIKDCRLTSLPQIGSKIE
jgi:hypothetical protein